MGRARSRYVSLSPEEIAARRDRFDAQQERERESLGKLYEERESVRRQQFDLYQQPAGDARTVEFNRLKLLEMQVRKGEQLLEAAARLQNRMGDVVLKLRTQGTESVPNSLGEVQGLGSDVDRLCAEYGLLRDLLTRS